MTVAFVMASSPASANGPAAHASATCSDHPNQAAAQRAGDTRDADGDGIYCESLPCPCSRGGAAPRPQPIVGERQGGSGTSRPPDRLRAQFIAARITSVIDGDTINVRAFGARRRFYTVRLIGIDTPETRKPGRPVECAGKRAAHNMLRISFSRPFDRDRDGLLDTRGGEGRRVTLRTDPSQDRFDRFGRMLAYVTTHGGVNLAVAQLSEGLARVFVFRRPFGQYSRFRSAQERARAGNRGAWRTCGGDFHRP